MTNFNQQSIFSSTPSSPKSMLILSCFGQNCYVLHSTDSSKIYSNDILKSLEGVVKFAQIKKSVSTNRSSKFNIKEEDCSHKSDCGIYELCLWNLQTTNRDMHAYACGRCTQPMCRVHTGFERAWKSLDFENFLASKALKISFKTANCLKVLEKLRLWCSNNVSW